jgi:hypothetical protein
VSEIAIAARPDGEGAFRPKTMMIVLAVGILSFLGLLVLGAYAPDLRSGRNGGAHALSNAATGFAGIVRLAEATGRHPAIARHEQMFETEDMVVLTPERPETDLSKLLQARGARITLVVLPKWLAVADQAKSGWVRSEGLLPAFAPEGVLAPQYKLKVSRHRSGGTRLQTLAQQAPPELSFAAPGALQTVKGSGLQTLIGDGRGGTVLGRLGDRQLYVLADPDLLSNHGIADERQAAAALAMLDYLNATDAGSIVFDVTLNGLGHSRSPLRLAFDPPFLAATLAIAAALLLAGIQALVRFGPTRRPERAIAFGKTALIDNATALVRKAGREAALGGRYAEVIRERAVIVFGVPARLRDRAIDEYLDRLGRRGRFSALAEAAAGARGREGVLAAAQALHQWQQEGPE